MKGEAKSSKEDEGETGGAEKGGPSSGGGKVLSLSSLVKSGYLYEGLFPLGRPGATLFLFLLFESFWTALIGNLVVQEGPATESLLVGALVSTLLMCVYSYGPQRNVMKHYGKESWISSLAGFMTVWLVAFVGCFGFFLAANVGGATGNLAANVGRWSP